MAIKAVIFDLGGVLFTNGTKKFIKDLAERYSLDEVAVKEVMDGPIGSQYREGKITRDVFWQRGLAKLGIAGNVDQLEDEWISDYALIEGTRDIILALRGNYKVTYLSDNVRERVEKVDALYHFKEWFDGGIFSHEVGVRKPDPKIYEFALQHAGVKAEESVFIDDKESSLVPAKAMGITTILFKDPGDLKAQLQKLSVL